MNIRTWHDFQLVGYAVDGKNNQLTFDLEWPYESPADVKRVRLAFSDVESYYLEHDLGSNIVYSFEERSLREFLMQWTERFESECTWGWPKF